MQKGALTLWRKALAALFVAVGVIGAPLAGSEFARAGGGGCALVQSERVPSEKILRCGQTLSVQPAEGTRYRLLYKAGQRIPAGAELNDGALLIEFHPTEQQKDFQILTPLAIAAVRGTRWAMEVSRARTSTLVLDGAVAVTNRRLNQYVILTEGQGVDISATDTSVVQKQWGQARIRALLARFGE